MRFFGVIYLWRSVQDNLKKFISKLQNVVTVLKKRETDLELRLRRNAIWAEDEGRLRQYGWVYEAEQIKTARIKVEKDLLDKATAESAARVAKREQELEAYRNMDPMAKLAMNPPSPEAVARARAEWGITDRPSWEIDK